MAGATFRTAAPKVKLPTVNRPPNQGTTEYGTGVAKPPPLRSSTKQSTTPQINKPPRSSVSVNRPSLGASMNFGNPNPRPPQNKVPAQPGGVRSTQAPSSLGGGRVISATMGTSTRPPRGNPIASNPAKPTPLQPAKPPSQTTPGPATQNAPDPSTPDTTFPIPLVPADEQAKTQAGIDYGDSYASNMLGLKNAIEAYGDPQLMAQYGMAASPNPNSALAMAALKAQLANRANDARMTDNGTFFSSINQFNRGQIADAQQRADLAGYQRYLTALANFNEKVRTAGLTRDNAIDKANLDERNTALANLPTAQTATGGFQGGTVQGSKVGKPSKTTTPSGKPVSQPKSSSVNIPKTGKGKSAGRSRTTVKSVSRTSVKKVGKQGKS